jgi:bifunctional non-homologous end joining protein LigD
MFEPLPPDEAKALQRPRDDALKIARHGEPSLLADIEYRAKSAEGKVRPPFFKGPREDL